MFQGCACHFGTNAHLALLFAHAIGLIDDGAGVELLRRRSLADAVNDLTARLGGFAAFRASRM